MEQFTYDITYDEFNPTIYFLGKNTDTEHDPLHSHDFAEIHYVLSGKGTFRVGDREYAIKPGDVLLCNPETLHHTTSCETPVELFYLAFHDFHFKDTEPNHFPLPGGEAILHTSSATKQELTRCCHDMIKENDSNRPGRYFMLKASLIKLMILIIRESEQYDQLHDGCRLETYRKGYAVDKIIDYLNENYEHKISLDQIARNMYLSPVYISKIFKEETGASPINYLIKIRLDKACNILMTEENPSIKEVAGRVGYEDVYHFSKLFKKYYGVAPLYYRKSMIESTK